MSELTNPEQPTTAPARRFVRRVAMALAMTTAAGVGAAAVTAAAVPDADGTIAACRSAATGELRVIDPDGGEACQGRSEIPLTWNQAGQPGPVGPVGPVGPAGSPGPVGPQGPGFTKTIQVQASGQLNPGQTKTLDVACPAGSIVTGGGWQPLEVDAIAEHLVVLADLPLKANVGIIVDRYRIRMKNGSTSTAQIFVYALCAK